MKKVLVFIIVLLLCGCTYIHKQFVYTKDELKIINSLSKENQELFDEYDDFLVSLIDNPNFKKENLITYIQYRNLLDADLIIELVNSNRLKVDTYDRLKNIVDDPNYKKENLKEYLKYYQRIDDSLLIKLINNNQMNEYTKICRLNNDPYYVNDNIDIYLEYYDENKSIREIIEYVNSKAYLTPYENEAKADVDKYGIYVLVNKYYQLDKDYEPDDLVDIEEGYGIGKLRREAYENYKKMQDAATKAGLSFYITSAYRSYETQEILYNNYLNNDPVEVVDTYSARPGNSEHQLGLAVDILTPGSDFGNFYKTQEASWLVKNAYKYGFIFRYPEDKIDITGYKYEAWHFRYVGDIARNVTAAGITYDEYFEKFIKKD